VPCDNAVSMSGLNTFHHRVESRLP
jgi:hypothetical protein